jgi:hypothetical protein
MPTIACRFETRCRVEDPSTARHRLIMSQMRYASALAQDDAVFGCARRHLSAPLGLLEPLAPLAPQELQVPLPFTHLKHTGVGTRATAPVAVSVPRSESMRKVTIVSLS